MMDEQMNVPRTLDEALKNDYKFWKTQPVPKLTEHITTNGPIDTCVVISDIPTKLPGGFEWAFIDLETELSTVSDFLKKNYVEDVYANFRLQYDEDFLRWALSGPTDNILLCVRTETTKQMIGFISGTIISCQLNREQLKVADINFLCVHRDFRNKRLSPVLIKEITRIVNFMGVFQAVYTVDTYLPTPFGQTKYYHRPINFERLVNIGFCHLEKGADINKLQQYYDLPSNVSDNFVLLKPEYINDVYEIYTDYLTKYNYHQNYSLEEFKHWLSYDKLHTYVYLDENNSPVDFISFYTLETKVLKLNETLNEGHILFYSSKQYTVFELISDALIVAKQNGVDVFTLLDIMENNESIPLLKCVNGTGQLNYYCYNWKIPTLYSNQIAKSVI